MHDVNNGLLRRGLQQLPMHLYKYKKESPFYSTDKENQFQLQWRSKTKQTYTKLPKTHKNNKFSKLGISITNPKDSLSNEINSNKALEKNIKLEPR